MGWGIAAGVVFLVVLILFFMPYRFRLRLHARGDPSGHWAVAGAGQWFVAVVSAVAARQVEPRIQVHLLKWVIWERSFSELWQRLREHDPDEERSLTERFDATSTALRERYQGFERWLSPGDVLAHVVQERKRIRVEALHIEVDYSFVDLATTGKWMAALYPLIGLMPPPLVLIQRPSFESVDQAELSIDGKITVFPGLVLVESVWFVIRHIKWRRADKRDAEASAS